MINTTIEKSLLTKRKSSINGMGIFTTQSVAKGTEFYTIPLAIVYNEPQPRCARIADKEYVHDDAVLN